MDDLFEDMKNNPDKYTNDLKYLVDNYSDDLIDLSNRAKNLNK
jgi:hypothetical protein